MSQPIVYHGGSRHLTPGCGYATPTTTLPLIGETLRPLPWRTEVYHRTSLRVDVGSVLGPAVVYVADQSVPLATVEAEVTAWARDPRVGEHYAFLSTGVGRPWSVDS